MVKAVCVNMTKLWRSPTKKKKKQRNINFTAPDAIFLGIFLFFSLKHYIEHLQESPLPIYFFILYSC